MLAQQTLVCGRTNGSYSSPCNFGVSESDFKLSMLFFYSKQVVKSQGNRSEVITALTHDKKTKSGCSEIPLGVHIYVYTKILTFLLNYM